MDNYKQKIFLLCALLIGCVLTSIGVEYFSFNDETVVMPQRLIQDTKINSLTNQLDQKTMEGNDSKIKPKVATSKAEAPKIATSVKQSYPININTATITELDALPGIGPAIAQRIVEFRNTQPFTKIEDIMLVKGIGKKKFAKLKELITVE